MNNTATMEQARYWMWTRRRRFPDLSGGPSFESWEEKAFAEDSSGGLGGCVWPPRSYSCTFCRREFRSAQALGGHMNVHRRDRARLKQSPGPTCVDHEQFPSFLPRSQICPIVYGPNPNPNNHHDHLESASIIVPPKISLFPPRESTATPQIFKNLLSGDIELKLGRDACYKRQRDLDDDEDEVLKISSKKRRTESGFPFFMRSNPVKQFLSSEVRKISVQNPTEELDLELRLG